MALSLRLALPLHLRERPGALLLAAARLPRHPARGVHRGAAPAGVLDRQALRPPLHHLLRAAGGDGRQLAPPADAQGLPAAAAGRPGPGQTARPAPDLPRRRLGPRFSPSFRLPHRVSPGRLRLSFSEGTPMSKQKKLTRREFAGAALVAAAAPALLRGALTPPAAGLTQEEKKPEAPKAQAPQQEEENWLERGPKGPRHVDVPAETEPAFVFRARAGGRHAR